MVQPATYPTTSASCTSVDNPHPWTSCNPGTDSCLSCLLRWTVALHCTLGGTTSAEQLSNWWLLVGSKKSETLYTASQEIDFDDELRKAATVSFKDPEGNDRQSRFFLCADGKAQVLMAGCQNWKVESPAATVCWVCMRSRAVCLATFCTASAIDAKWIGAVTRGAIYGTITSDRPVPDYGLHGVLLVLLRCTNGTRDLVVQLTGMAPTTVPRTMLQLVLDEARLAARTCSRATLNNDKAGSKGREGWSVLLLSIPCGSGDGRR